MMEPLDRPAQNFFRAPSFCRNIRNAATVVGCFVAFFVAALRQKRGTR
jgi:hypothetical protein